MHRPIAQAALLLFSGLLLGSCSQAPESSEEASMAAPDITGSSAARGVAFDFNFTFALPARAIAKVQRQHVAACEQLGIARCRIVGVGFDQEARDQASGSLSLLLAPTDAYGFAGRAVDVVEAAKGEIDTALVRGRDAGGALVQARQSQNDAGAEIARLEARLRQAGLSEGERRDLSAKLEELHRSAGEQTATVRENTEALAVTPVSFRYVDQGALKGENRFLRATSQSWTGVQDMLIIGVILLGYLLPWALVIGGAIYLVRLVRRRLRRSDEVSA